MVAVTRIWSAERDAVLRRHAKVDRDFPAMLAEINALPGEPVASVDAVKTRWYKAMSRLDGRTWTAARNALVISMRLNGRDWEDIKAAVNKLPGDKINSPKSVQNQHAFLKKTAEFAVPHSQVSLLANIAPVAAGSSPAAGALTQDVSSQNSPPAGQEPEALFLDGEVPVSYEHARKWACRRGLCGKAQGFNLIAVNVARVKMGLPKFLIMGAL